MCVVVVGVLVSGSRASWVVLTVVVDGGWWLLAAGCWLLAAGCWLLGGGRWEVGGGR